MGIDLLQRLRKMELANLIVSEPLEEEDGRTFVRARAVGGQGISIAIAPWLPLPRNPQLIPKVIIAKP
jgi:hypothetical protein